MMEIGKDAIKWVLGGHVEEAELVATVVAMTGSWMNPHMRRAAVLAAMTPMSAGAATAAVDCAVSALLFILFLRMSCFFVSLALYSVVSSFLGLRDMMGPPGL